MTTTFDLKSALAATAHTAAAPRCDNPSHDASSAVQPSVQRPVVQQPLVQEPEEELIFTARRKITLQCGQSSITLHPNGKIILRGEYILSAAQGTNRIVGGQIEIN